MGTLVAHKWAAKHNMQTKKQTNKPTEKNRKTCISFRTESVGREDC